MKKEGGIRTAALLTALMLVLGGYAAAEDPVQWSLSPSKNVTETAADPTEPPEEPSVWDIRGDILVACRSQDASVTVPDGIREIGPNAFRGLGSLETVILPDSVERIGAGAFADCGKLRLVLISAASKLSYIGDRAFLNCVSLDTGFVPAGAQVADNAFEGVPGAAEPADEPDSPDEPGPSPENEPDPGTTDEPEEPVPHWGGGGGYASGMNHPHNRNTVPAGPDYDQLAVTEWPEEPVSQLTLGGEVLPLSLEEENTETGGFTVSAIRWQDPDAEEPDTLILTAVDGTEGEKIWALNGEVLRRLDKSGVGYLVFRVGERIAVMETGDCLAGWVYDELRSRGTASRRFDYQIQMRDNEEIRWTVQVMEKTYELTGDPHTDLYLTGAYSADADVLEGTRPETEEAVSSGAA